MEFFFIIIIIVKPPKKKPLPRLLVRLVNNRTRWWRFSWPNLPATSSRFGKVGEEEKKRGEKLSAEFFCCKLDLISFYWPENKTGGCCSPYLSPSLSPRRPPLLATTRVFALRALMRQINCLMRRRRVCTAAARRRRDGEGICRRRHDTFTPELCGFSLAERSCSGAVHQPSGSDVFVCFHWQPGHGGEATLVASCSSGRLTVQVWPVAPPAPSLNLIWKSFFSFFFHLF